MAFTSKVACICYQSINWTPLWFQTNLFKELFFFLWPYKTKVCKTQCLLHTCLCRTNSCWGQRKEHKTAEALLTLCLFSFCFEERGSYPQFKSQSINTYWQANRNLIDCYWTPQTKCYVYRQSYTLTISKQVCNQSRSLKTQQLKLT